MSSLCFPASAEETQNLRPVYTELGNTNQHAQTQKSLQKSRKLSFILGKVFGRACCSLQWAFTNCHLWLTHQQGCVCSELGTHKRWAREGFGIPSCLNAQYAGKC